MIIPKPNKFYSPSSHRRQINNTPAENGDFTIETPSLEFKEESYALLNVVGRKLHNDEGLDFGNIELVKLKVICKQGKSLYHGLPELKTYEYIMTQYLYDVNEE